MSKRSQSYGPNSASAAPIIASTPANSYAAASTCAGSAHTRHRGDRSRDTRSPTANANRYGGIGCGISHFSIATSPSSVRPRSAAAITALSVRGIVSSAVYLMRRRGVSCSGMIERAWHAWHCENRYGSLPPFVCAGSSHCSAEASGDVR